MIEEAWEREQPGPTKGDGLCECGLHVLDRRQPVGSPGRNPTPDWVEAPRISTIALGVEVGELLRTSSLPEKRHPRKPLGPMQEAPGGRLFGTEWNCPPTRFKFVGWDGISVSGKVERCHHTLRCSRARSAYGGGYRTRAPTSRPTYYYGHCTASRATRSLPARVRVIVCAVFQTRAGTRVGWLLTIRTRLILDSVRGTTPLQRSFGPCCHHQYLVCMDFSFWGVGRPFINRGSSVHLFPHRVAACRGVWLKFADGRRRPVWLRHGLPRCVLFNDSCETQISSIKKIKK